jgi:hypothetical protein
MAQNGDQAQEQQHQGVDPNAPLNMGQASLLFEHIMRKSDERLAPLLRQVNHLEDLIAAQGQNNPAQPSADPLSNIKRKHDAIFNEGLKKQYQPLEEVQIRMDAVNEAPAKAAEENRSISPEEASNLQKILDEGKQISSKRLQFLEVAHVEGWEVAKCMEKNTFLMELDEDTEKQLKRARKDAKALETEKKEKKSGNAHSNRRGYFFRRGGGGRGGYGGFRGGYGRGFAGGYGGGMQRGGPRACFSCGQIGHLSANCPQRGMHAVHAGRQMA